MAVMRDPAERKARQDQKRRLILRFLRTEIFSTPAVLSELIGTADPRTITRTANALARDGLVVREVVTIGWRNVHLIGITPHGQAMAWRPDDGEPLIEKVYERGRVGLTIIDHTLDLQRLRIRLSRAGWKGWMNADQIAPGARANAMVRNKAYKRPDALVRHPERGVIAIECERSIKSMKRYQAIVESHLAGIKTGSFSAAVWTCPTPELAAALRRVLDSIGYVRVQGQSMKLGPGERAKLLVTDYESIVTL